MTSSQKKHIAALLFSAVAIVAASGILVTKYGKSALMADHAHGAMHTCPMSASEHVDWWQSFFASVLPAASLVGVLFFATSLGGAVPPGRVVFEIAIIPISKWRFRAPSPPPLQLQFTDGLLHPRLYA